MINFKDIIFTQVTARFKKAGVDIDELIFKIDLTDNTGMYEGWYNDKFIFDGSMQESEFTLIQKAFCRKIISRYSKEKNDITNIYLSLDLIKNDYELFIIQNDKLTKIKF